MKNVTISLPEEVLEALRDKARAQKMSLNAWMRQCLTELVHEPEDPSAEVLRIASMVAEERKPWKWNRDEAHER